jgi:chemotaxis protein CheZ
VANQAEQIHQAVSATIRTEIDALRRFVDRRIAELSTEIHAASDLMDFGETNLSRQLSAIRDQIASVVAPPMAATHNSGLELEAVVQATEEAANRILEAAEAIGDWLRETTHEPAVANAMHAKVNAIFEACSFQDVTSQRIRRAIQHLQQVEGLLTGIAAGEDAPGAGQPDDHASATPAHGTATGGPTPGDRDIDPDLKQAAVDSLFDRGILPSGANGAAAA